MVRPPGPAPTIQIGILGTCVPVHDSNKERQKTQPRRRGAQRTTRLSGTHDDTPGVLVYTLGWDMVMSLTSSEGEGRYATSRALLFSGSTKPESAP